MIIEPGSIILTPKAAQFLYQAADIRALRNKYRVGNSFGYDVLTTISVCAFSDADPGNLPRQDAASEERSWWTVHQVAKAAGRSVRAVRLDCQHGNLPATKHNTGWLIRDAEAKTYIEARKATK